MAAVALRRGWNYLVLLAAIGTIIIVWAWVGFTSDLTRITLGGAVILGFELQFLLVFLVRRKEGGPERWTMLAAGLSGLAALGFSFFMLADHGMVTQRVLLFGFVALADIGVLALALGCARREPWPSIAGLIVFLFLTCWTEFYLKVPLLWWALGSYFGFALLHAGFAAASSTKRHFAPALCAAAPFFLLGMAIDQLPLVSPTPIFVLAFLLAFILLGQGIVWRANWIAAVALAGLWGNERTWQSLHFAVGHAAITLAWYVVFALLFLAFPFFVHDKKQQTPWAVSAVSGLLHFWLIYEVVQAAYPVMHNGLLPAFFIAPYALGIFYLVGRIGIKPVTGDAKLAWQGAAVLMFVSLIFPIQLEREWITLGWALEGLALILLFRALPHRGLRLAGTLLLAIAFVRLALNPTVLEYHKRSGIRIWNWYLYTYGITSACLLLAARHFGERTGRWERAVPPLLYSLSAILLFLLLNIEIADYFSIGPTLTFSFSGDFARDMTYSIAWAVFAFVLLIIGMRRKTAAARYAALALLLVTLVKLFLHDLGNLSQLYRIGAFFGVALVLIIASFVYQRFVKPGGSRSPSAMG